jgi:hypothetical protein
MGNVKNGCGCVVMLVVGVVLIGMFSSKPPAPDISLPPEPQERLAVSNQAGPVTVPQSNFPPSDVQLTILDSDIIPSIKRSIDVRLSRKVSANELEAIGRKLKADDRRSYERTFIGYLLPRMEKGQGYWARTDFDPNLKIAILGLTVEEEASLRSFPDDPSRNVLGCWLLEGASLGHRYTLLEQAGTVSMETGFKDGSSTAVTVQGTVDQNGITIRSVESSHPNDYWFISSDGALHFGDEDGIWNTAFEVVRAPDQTQLKTIITKKATEADAIEKRRIDEAELEKATKRAGSYITMTKQLLQNGKAGAPQAKWMRGVIEDLPDTELATQAAELLRQIPQ